MSTKRTHEADGLFYLSVELLRGRGACSSGLAAFRAGAKSETGRYPTETTRVPVTLKLVTKTLSVTYCGGFLLDILSYRGGHRSAEFREARGRYWNHCGGTPETAAVAVMDAILAYSKLPARTA